MTRNYGTRTIYKGETFDSRTEAHWAALMDKIGWDWISKPGHIGGVGSAPHWLPDGALTTTRGWRR